MTQAKEVLAILDECSEKFTFPMLDNGYIYPAATCLTAFYGVDNWAIVIEVFGYSPRAGIPDTSVYTFASQIANRSAGESFVNAEAHQNYLANNPNNEMSSVFPIAEGTWQDPDNSEVLRSGTTCLEIRGQTVSLPERSAYAESGIQLSRDDEIQVFECCRYLAKYFRHQLMCTEQERRQNVTDGLKQVIQLNEWNHPDLVGGEKPSDNETFQQLVKVLATGNSSDFRHMLSPNTHWSNWPEGGTL